MLGDLLWLLSSVGRWNSCEISISSEVLLSTEDKGSRPSVGLVEPGRRVSRMLKSRGRDFVSRSCFERLCCRLASKTPGSSWREDLCVGMGFMVKPSSGLKG